MKRIENLTWGDVKLAGDVDGTKYIYMLFTGLEVRIGKNCARRLKTEGTVFPIRTDLGR